MFEDMARYLKIAEEAEETLQRMYSDDGSDEEDITDLLVIKRASLSLLQRTAARSMYGAGNRAVQTGSTIASQKADKKDAGTQEKKTVRISASKEHVLTASEEKEDNAIQMEPYDNTANTSAREPDKPERNIKGVYEKMQSDMFSDIDNNADAEEETESCRRDEISYAGIKVKMPKDGRVSFLIFPIGSEYAVIMSKGKMISGVMTVSGRAVLQTVPVSECYVQKNGDMLRLSITQEGQNIVTDGKLKGSFGKHPVISDTGIKVHILPYSMHNGPDGTASYLYLIDQDGEQRIGDSANDRTFQFGSYQMEVSAQWKEDILTAEVGESNM